MFLTDDAPDSDTLKALIDEALRTVNDRFTEKVGNTNVDSPIRLSISLSANGIHRTNLGLCRCQVSPGVFRWRRCKPGGGC